MRKRLLPMFLVCCLLASLLTVGTTAAENTVHDVYTATDLAQMAGKNETYYLRNDLDLTSYGNWTPINFSGIFDGQGHTIKGIKVSGYNGHSGFFSTLSGTVKNLHLDVDITGSQNGNYNNGTYRTGYATGGLAGMLDKARVDSVYISGRVRGRVEVGGLTGYSHSDSYNNRTVISNCYSTVSVNITEGVFTSASPTGRFGCASLIGNTPVSKFLRQSK